MERGDTHPWWPLLYVYGSLFPLSLVLWLPIYWFCLPRIHSPFCWQLLSDFLWGKLCSLLLDLGLDEVDFTAELRVGPVTQAWQGKPHLLLGQYGDGGMSQSADVQLLYVEWFKNSSFYTWRTYLVVSSESLPSNIPFIMLNICFFCCCLSILENL